MARKGFTLVELSIVLVGVGLLISGVLIGQILMDSSRVTSTVKQIGEFDSAVAAFQVKYRALPGDSKQHGGDGDGAIECYLESDGCIMRFNNEIANFWAQAFPDKYVATAYLVADAPVAAYNTGSLKNSPKPLIGLPDAFWHASAVQVYNSMVDGSPFSGNRNPDMIANYYSLTRKYRTASGSTFIEATVAKENRTLRASELMDIDSKMDDGKPTTGIVISGWYKNFGAQNRGTPQTSSYPSCASSTAYLVEDSTYQCSPFFRMGGTTGGLK